VGFAGRAALGLAGVVAVGVALALVAALVASRWAPLQALDTTVVDAANDAVGRRPAVVSVLRFMTNLGGAEAAWLLLPATAAWLLLRRSPRLALYVAVTGIGLLVLDRGTKALVGRVRPLVDLPVAAAPGGSFPSGHAMGSTVTYGVLLLVFLPAVPRRLRPAVVAAAVALAVTVGLTRVALGVHYPSDVVGGWLLGVLWLAVTATAFSSWRRQEGLGRREAAAMPEGAAALPGGIAPESGEALVPAPAHDAPLPQGWRSAATLMVAWVLIWGVLLGLGLLVTEVRSPVDELDAAVARWFAGLRTETLTPLAVAAGVPGGTAGVTAVVVVAVPVVLAATRRWAPVLFVVVCVVGETALFLAVSAIVGRARPAVEHLSGELPPTSSFPSGHVAATAATYGALALLALAWTERPARYVAPAVAVLLVVGVALSRLYRGVHHPTDVLASVLYGTAWVYACWRTIRPARGAPEHQAGGADQGAGR
jgi:undecaprenyl-diphosphatase